MILHDIVTILEGVEKGSIYIGMLPDRPDCACALYLSGGEPVLCTLDGAVVERPFFKVTVRDTSGEQAVARASAIAALLDGYSGDNIAYIASNRGFASDGRDEQGRSLLSAEFAAKVERSG